MPAWSYEAVIAGGARERGEVEAPTPRDAARLLAERERVVVRLAPAARPAAPAPRLPRRLRSRDLATACRQLATLVEGGVPLVPALRTIAGQDRRQRALWLGVAARITGGATFATALAPYRGVLTPLFVSMIAAGEASGHLEDVLGSLAEHFEREADVTEKVRGALTYPKVVLSVAVSVMLFVVSFLLPRFSAFFAGLGAHLPAMTLAVMALGHFMSRWWWAVVAAGVAALQAFTAWRRGPGRVAWDALVLRAPVFGDLTRKIATARLAHTLAVLLGAGVPILDALDLAADTAGNVRLAEPVRAAREKIRRGATIAESLNSGGQLPPLFIQMTAVGEQVGSLDSMLDRVARVYDGEVTRMTGRLTQLLEPFLIVGLGVVVGTLVISIALPMFQMFSLVHQ